MKKDASRFSPKGVLFHRTFFTALSLGSIIFSTLFCIQRKRCNSVLYNFVYDPRPSKRGSACFIPSKIIGRGEFSQYYFDFIMRQAPGRHQARKAR